MIGSKIIRKGGCARLPHSAKNVYIALLLFLLIGLVDLEVLMLTTYIL